MTFIDRCFVLCGFTLASWSGSTAAHPGHYDGLYLAQAAKQEIQAVVPAIENMGQRQTVTNMDRQIAFFESELLTHLALHSPTPSQEDALQLAFADHRLVTNMPGKPTLEKLERIRADLYQQLRNDFATCPIRWTATQAVIGDLQPLEVAVGLSRHVLLEVSNEGEKYVDLSAWQEGNDQAPRTKYTLHAGRTVFLPVEVSTQSLEEDSVTIELTTHSEQPETRIIKIPIKAVRPAVLKGRIYDSNENELSPARVYVLGSDHGYRRGKKYANNETLSTKQLLQFWNLGKYYQLPFFYSDGTFEVEVPPGKTTIYVERGFEHKIVKRELTLVSGETRELELASQRLIDMREQGWVSGDTHVHWVTNQWNVDMPLELLSVIQRAEDLRVANNLTLLQRGPSRAFINPAQAPMGTVEEYSDEFYHVEMGEEYRNEDLYGHLCFLNLDWLVQPIGTGSVIAGPDALDYPINKTAILACREQGGISCEAHGLGGNKDVPVNVVHGLTDSLDQIRPRDYYDFLDCGFHLPLTNGSDHPARVLGSARAYVKVDGDFTYEKWIEGIRQCRTFTTSGPLVFLEVNKSGIGETLEVSADETLRIRAEVISRRPIGSFQILSNGEVLKEINTAQSRAVLELTIPANESRWVVARCSPTDNYNAIEQVDAAHTSAIYVNVDGEPRFVPKKAKRWISEMGKHIRDIEAKGHFANDSQRQEAIDYVEAGIEQFESMVAEHKPIRLQTVSTEVKESAAEVETKWPTIKRVDAQPLLVQVKRLSEALDFIGNPLPEATKQKLDELRDEPSEAKVAQIVQELLDPLCIAAVEIDEGKLTASRQENRHEIVERGWRSFLVKVCNRSDLTSRLRLDSPNARTVPHAKQEDVESRWMGLAMFDGRPLQPNLSGLELEYRIVQIYSRDQGDKDAVLEFSIDAEPGKRGRQIREWRFDRDADGWNAMNQAEVVVRDGSLHVKSTGLDPFIGAEVGGATGELLLRFWAESEKDGVGQIHWWTEEQPAADGLRVVTFPLLPGASKLYELVIPVQGVLSGIRIDTNMKPGLMRFDWIDLCYAHRQGETWDSVPLKFESLAAVPVKLHIEDKPGEPAVASLDIRDRLRRVYPEQTKRLAPDFFFHPQIYRKDGETISLPPGEYKITCQRGPHSIPETKTLVVGDQPTTFHYKVRRWIDPTKSGWWSGDHHIHSAGCLHYENPTKGVHPEDMVRHTMGEDLNVGCCLTWGPCFDYQKQFFTGETDQASQYPYLIRYDIEVSGFGSHASGHLDLLRLREQIPPGGDSKHHWPTLGLNTLRWAKKQGAICGPAHSANGLSNYIGRLGHYKDGPKGLPHFNIPAFDGIGANEYIVDVTHQVEGPDGVPVPAIDFISAMDTPRKDEWNMWYHTLNCGFRTRVSGETDFPCMSGERVGIGRVYVHVGGKLNFEDWVQGIQDGRSYVSDGYGHLLDFEARRSGEERYRKIGHDGSEISAQGKTQIQCRAKCAIRLADTNSKASVELIANGYPVATMEIPADGSLQEVELSAEVDRSSWLAMRIFPHAHTNPFFVIVDDKPIRASKASAEWCLRGVDQCWKEKKPTYDEDEQHDARQAYEHARQVYKTILAECEE
ncbi:MAG: CehA/McbA family metallohydrolase [Lacipirellulaceae bacterium]